MLNNEFISEFLDSDTIAALPSFISSKDNFKESADKIACAFGSKPGFSSMIDEDVKKLSISFKNNLTLLIQKTWVEKSDIALKDKVLLQLNKILKDENSSWISIYPLFLEIINQSVYLMFGQPTNTPEFSEYAIRIDPEFGIFWWYISSLPTQIDWNEEKCRIAIMLGMYFLANY